MRHSYPTLSRSTRPRTAQDSVTVNLPATVTFTYDANGNLTGDGRRVFEYDYENQLTNVYVASAWRESMKYDAFGRKRVLQQHHWTGSAWLLTNEVRYSFSSTQGVFPSARASYWESYCVAKSTCGRQRLSRSMGLKKGAKV